MTGDRRVGVSAAATARAQALPADVAPPPGTPVADRPAGPEPHGAEPQDPDPLDTGPLPGPSSVEADVLLRAQLRIALGTLAVVVALVAGLPALLVLVPAIARARPGGVPVCSLVLLLAVQPILIVVSLWQLRRAERAERELPGPVERP
ncbi:hypothetical protein GCM10022254_24550 [Actinomadura meridiana]|uniref:DUF485 domain-containing protein n=1 Tax=Actinomadura meridiana TaxID=559626 RepID=A0ABP8BYK9_9ACTN